MHEDEFGKEAADFVRKPLYMDDGASSKDQRQDVKDLIKSATELCAKNHFRLHKYVSNDKEVLDSIPLSERGTNIQAIDIHRDKLPMERTLGMQWCVESDSFQFRVSLQDKPLTRRGILSTVSSIYDPLGLVSSFLLGGKLIVQERCKNGASWDDPVSDDIRARWEKWRIDLEELAKLTISRAYTETPLSKMKAMELHSFSDASLTAYGQCSYLRAIDEDDRVEAALVMSKARVAPTKAITVPRLELGAALVSVKVGKLLGEALEIGGLRQFFYTEGMVVLGYLSNESKRFHIFVANRVQGIRNCTTTDQWRHVDTSENPADLASRGTSARELIESGLWWSGPDFLKTKDLPAPVSYTELSPQDPEVKGCATVLKTETNVVKGIDSQDMLERFGRFSCWFKLKKAVALCQRYIDCLKLACKKPRAKLPEPARLSVEELRRAELTIVRITQINAFPEEINTLTTTQGEGDKPRRISARSRLYCLDPFLDGKDGVIRVGGRV
ncbi:uncharacterized protein LOC135489965 [Lineus longissimus]|uniref:uncharacterized protein LOC135489965 n=1 Tax=Lineus longissimus TaxID=88925 RepID=UPI00315CEA0E